MKFYYNDKLVRTSKTHIYTHAVMFNENLIACSSSYDLAVKRLNEFISKNDKNMEYYEEVITKYENGIKSKVYSNGRYKTMTDEIYNEYVEMLNRAKEYRKEKVNNTHIVELEQR